MSCKSGNLGALPDKFLDHVFWCAVSAVGQIVHRLVVPYTRLPWSLATLVDGTATMLKKQNELNRFMAMNSCCLSEGFCRPLRAQLQPELNGAELLPEGKLHGLLQSAFQCLPFNVLVENAFARLKSMQKTNRGRSDLSHTLACRHVLAEVKALHLQHLQRSHTQDEPLPDMDDTDADDCSEQPLPLPQDTEDQQGHSTAW